MRKPKTFCLFNRQRKHSIDAAGVRRFLSELEACGPEIRTGQPPALPDRTFAVVFVTDKVMHEYNRRYRKMDKPTDVLSFEGEGDYLGDIVISTETAWKQTEGSPTLSFDKNIRRLLLHGFLHLNGYDHETDNGEMRAIERRLRARFGC